MKPKHFISAVFIAAILSGCSQFSKEHFYTESFGIDLRPYTLTHESSYTDGILEVYNVFPADDLYKAVFEKNNVQRTTSSLFGYGWKTYYPSEDSPILYVTISRSNEPPYGKYILYLPQKKMMVFIYTDAVGG